MCLLHVWQRRRRKVLGGDTLSVPASKSVTPQEPTLRRQTLSLGAGVKFTHSRHTIRQARHCRALPARRGMQAAPLCMPMQACAAQMPALQRLSLPPPVCPGELSLPPPASLHEGCVRPRMRPSLGHYQASWQRMGPLLGRYQAPWPA
eukprot:363786-Chlamydomonas_euryale.AAC.5